jgi:diguanylate cyclase (GGDEF)-like protein
MAEPAPAGIMRSATLASLRRPRPGLRIGVNLIRARLWVAMLGLAILPMVGVILLTNVFSPRVPANPGEQRSWETATGAADLTARLNDLETLLLGAAARPELARLLDGVDGIDERELVTLTLATLRDGGKAPLVDACLTRGSDGYGVSLVASAAVVEASAADTLAGVTAAPDCVPAVATDRGQAVAPGSVALATRSGADGRPRLTLSTALLGASRREAGQLTADLDLELLFEGTPTASAAAASALLVDMSTNTVLTDSRADDLASSAGGSDGRPLGNLGIHVNGIVSGHPGTARALEQAGWVATAAPLWQTDDGARLGLIHVWELQPSGPNMLLVGALVTFAVVVLLIAIAVAWSFLRPFDDLAKSQAQLEVLYREAREDSLHDGLTGLGNHRSFQEELDRQMETYRRHKVPFALLLIDLDDLKVVNDGEGHPAGDRLLVGMANSIRDALRYGDRPFRIGGDEFAVIMPHTDAGDAHVAANRLRHFCLRPPAGERVIPFSGGISSIPMLAADRTDLFRQADAALYRCKRNGRGTVEVYDADRDQLPEETTVQGGVTAIRDVIRARKLMPVFQPIVDLRDGKVLGFEGLVRPTPGSPFSNPGQLFSAAAAAGRTVELDLACFEVVAAGSVDIDISQVVTINLSPQTLEVEDFSAAWLLEILARHHLSTGRVIVELTEREAINDLERLRRNIAALQHAGVRLAADDVGAGNAGLRLLSQLRFDIVKIDLSLVQDGAHHDSSRNVVRSLMDLASRQGAVAIAEGLETADQLRSLRELGITVGQGYLLGRPGRNLGLSHVDIEALASGALIVEAAPARRRVGPQPAPSDALGGSPA